MNLDITPEPDEAERAAIEAALAAEEKENEASRPAPWTRAGDLPDP